MIGEVLYCLFPLPDSRVVRTVVDHRATASAILAGGHRAIRIGAEDTIIGIAQMVGIFFCQYAVRHLPGTPIVVTAVPTIAAVSTE